MYHELIWCAGKRGLQWNVRRKNDLGPVAAVCYTLPKLFTLLLKGNVQLLVGLVVFSPKKTAKKGLKIGCVKPEPSLAWKTMKVAYLFVLLAVVNQHCSEGQVVREVAVNRTAYGDTVSYCQTVLRSCEAGSSLYDAAKDLRNSTCIRDSEIGDHMEETSMNVSRLLCTS